jgi:hypothetical protein
MCIDIVAYILGRSESRVVKLDMFSVTAEWSPMNFGE